MKFNRLQLKRLSAVCADLGKAAIIGATGIWISGVDIAVPRMVILAGEFVGGYLIGLSVRLLKEIK